jgi:hypothetical protein
MSDHSVTQGRRSIVVEEYPHQACIMPGLDRLSCGKHAPRLGSRALAIHRETTPGTRRQWPHLQD